MKKTLVKICGITNHEDAQAAVKHGADALGFVFYAKSRRYISYATARDLCVHITEGIMKVGVFVNEKPEMLAKLHNENFLTHFQFSGDESQDICNNFPEKSIKVFKIKTGLDPSELENYRDCTMFLFDAGVDGVFGGTGKTFDWGLLKAVHSSKPIILAGGLTEHNVARAIHMVKPYMVDVSSGVESAPGKKDARKIARFIRACRSVT